MRAQTEDLLQTYFHHKIVVGCCHGKMLYRLFGVASSECRLDALDKIFYALFLELA